MAKIKYQAQMNQEFEAFIEFRQIHLILTSTFSKSTFLYQCHWITG